MHGWRNGMIHSRKVRLAAWLGCLLAIAPLGRAQQLKLNPRLDYNSDSMDGPLITGNNTTTGAVPGKPNYVMIYGEGCYNSKRQARRTVALANHYADQVNFVIIDLDRPQSPAQQALVHTYYQGSIPDLILLDGDGKPLYNRAGEQSEEVLSSILDKALKHRPEERH
jgi:deoxyinosine 3'endonuclease (endonuclease V)